MLVLAWVAGVLLLLSIPFSFGLGLWGGPAPSRIRRCSTDGDSVARALVLFVQPDGNRFCVDLLLFDSRDGRGVPKSVLVGPAPGGAERAESLLRAAAVRDDLVPLRAIVDPSSRSGFFAEP